MIMTLTPSSIRIDLKCGKGAISEGEKCHVGPATKVKKGQLSPRELKRASSKLSNRPQLKKRYVAIAAYAALTAASLYQAKNIRQAYAQKFDPAERYTAYKGAIGDPATVIKQMQGSGKTGAPSLFGEVTFGKLDNKDIVVKRLGMKGTAGASQITAMELQGVISNKTAQALRRAQGSLQTNEVQGAELAGKLGFGPRVVAAGNNSLITEVAKGRPLSSQDRLARNGAKLQQELLQDPGLAVKKIAKLQWLGFTKGTEVSTVNKNRIIENMARMHTAGVSHNDLHPGNIFISDKGAQFIDFGTSERGGGSVAAEFVRMMNPPRAGLQQNGGMGYNLRSVDPKGYAVTEKSLRQAIGKKVGQLTAADIHKAVETSKNRDALEKRLQSITDEYYRGYANRRPNWEEWRANAPKAGSTEEERAAFKSFFERNTPGLKRGDSGAHTYLTPALIRSDSKGRPCGQSHIAATKICQKKGAFPSSKAIAVGLTTSAVGAALLHKGSRKAILNSPRTLQRATQRGITEVVHRMTAKPPSMRLTPRAFEQIKPPSKTERLNQAARSANVNAEEAMRKAAQAEIERGVAVGQAMYAAGKATRASLRSGVRRHNLTVEKLRRRYEPGYRKPRRDNYIQYYAPTQLQPPTRRDTEDGKKYTKTVTNPETGRKNKVRYGAKGYKIAPGTNKGDRYCARSFGDMKSEGYDCSGAERNTPLCLSRAKWKCSGKTSRRDGLTPGEVLGLVRSDAPKGAQGKPCGESHIPKQHKCSKNSRISNNNNLQTAAKVALAAGVIAGGAYLIKSRYISPQDWEKHPANRLNNPKMTEDEAQRIADEAIAGGQKWDVQEKINARRRAERATECGGGLGKIQAPAKFDAAVPNPRCQAGEGAYGTYFVHSSEKYGVKVFRDGPYDDVKSEFRRLDKADYAGVNVPEPKRIGKVKDQNGDIKAQTLVMSHMKGYAPIDDAYHHPYGTAANAPLIVAVKAAREFRKLHTAGLAHGDIHSGNVMADTRSKRVALVDFGYATELHDGRQRNHGRNGVENLMHDMNRLPEFLGFDNRGEDFIKRYKGTLENVEKQAKELARYGSPDIKERFTIAVKRYHDALESELLWNDRMPRSRFISGADQPRIPGLTRRLLTAKFPNTLEREVLENVHGLNLSMFEKGAKILGVKPARLFLALKPERDARLARERKKPFGTPLVP